jgi:hypothetical protein
MTNAMEIITKKGGHRSAFPVPIPSGMDDPLLLSDDIQGNTPDTNRFYWN